MIDKIKNLCVKYREIIVYLIVGVLTTAVSWLACFLAKLILDPSIAWQNSLINLIGWIAGVGFAYPTNRKWVFQSRSPHILKEMAGFVSSRITTGVIEILLMNLTVNLMKMSFWPAKILVSVVVVVLNYVFSKLFVFRKGKE